MSYVRTSGSPGQNVFELQAAATLSQTNPVSATLYTVLDTTKNVRIISIASILTWATTQPTPLDVVATVDGQSVVFSKTNPVSDTWYGAHLVESNDWTSELLGAISAYTPYRAFLLEGRSVKVETRITWATTQPTPLICRVKYAKIP